jgi:hypothetical protein
MKISITLIMMFLMILTFGSEARRRGATRYRSSKSRSNKKGSSEKDYKCNRFTGWCSLR